MSPQPLHAGSGSGGVGGGAAPDLPVAAAGGGTVVPTPRSSPVHSRERDQTRRHSETCAALAQRLASERVLLGSLSLLRAGLGAKPTTWKVDKLFCIRIASGQLERTNCPGHQSVSGLLLTHTEGSDADVHRGPLHCGYHRDLAAGR